MSAGKITEKYELKFTEKCPKSISLNGCVIDGGWATWVVEDSDYDIGEYVVFYAQVPTTDGEVNVKLLQDFVNRYNKAEHFATEARDAKNRLWHAMRVIEKIEQEAVHGHFADITPSTIHALIEEEVDPILQPFLKTGEFQI